MTVKPRLFADFQNADPSGRLRLNCRGTAHDLNAQGINLRDGLEVVLHSGDLEADGRVEFSPEEAVWVAWIDREAIRSTESDPNTARSDSVPTKTQGVSS